MKGAQISTLFQYITPNHGHYEKMWFHKSTMMKISFRSIWKFWAEIGWESTTCPQSLVLSLSSPQEGQKESSGDAGLGATGPWRVARCGGKRPRPSPSWPLIYPTSKRRPPPTATAVLWARLATLESPEPNRGSGT